MPDVAALLQVKIDVDDREMTSGFAGASQKINSFGSALGSVVVAGAAVATAALAGVAVAGVKMAGDLQQSVANISTIKPEIDTSAVFDALNEMSTRIPQSAEQLGDALYNVFSSVSVSAEEGLKLTETFAKGAIGASTDAQTFGTAAMGVMNAYGLAVSDAAHISDVFFNTIALGVVEGPELAASLGPVTAAAKAAGVGLDEMGAMIVGVTKAGGPAAQNINNLNNLLQKITTNSAQLAMQKLGVATTDATGNFRPQIEVLRDLKTSLAGMTESARASALQSIFPDAQARQGAQAIMDQLGFVDEALATNRTAVGVTEAAYEKMSATFNSQSKLLMNTLMSIGTSIGAAILPHITPIITAFAKSLPRAFELAKIAFDDLGQIFSGEDMKIELAELMSTFGLDKFAPAVHDIVRQVGDAWRTIGQAFAGAWEPSDTIDPLVNAVGIAAVALRELIAVVQQFAAPIAAFVAGFGGAIVAAGLASAAIGALAGVLALLLSPIGLVAIAVGLLAAAWQTNFMGIQEQTAAMWAVVQPVLAQLVDWLGAKIPPVLNWISTVGWPALVAAGLAVSEWITGTAIPALTQLVDWLGPKLVAVTTWISGTGWPALVTAGEAVYAMVQQVIKFFTDLFTELEKRGVFTELQTIWDKLVVIGDKLWAMIQKVAEALAPVFEWVSKLVAAAVMPALVLVMDQIGQAAAKSAGPVDTVAAAIKGVVTVVGSAIIAVEKFLEVMGKLSKIKMPSFSLPGFGGGGGGGGEMLSYTGTGAWQATTPGGFTNNAERLAFVRMVAGEFGHDQDIVVRAATLEGAGAAGPVGDGGRSFGALQAYTAGGQGNTFMNQTGLDPSDPNNEKALVRWQISNLRNTGWQPFNGPKSAGITGFQGINTGPPPAAQRRPGDMDRIPLSNAPGGSPAQWPGFMNETFEQLPKYLQSLETIQGKGTETFSSVARVGQDQGAAMADAQTDALSMVLTTYTNAAGEIVGVVTEQASGVVAATATQNAGVIQQYNVLDTAVQASVQATATGVNTTLTDSSGNMVTTVTTANGEILTQYAALANGAILNMGAMDLGMTTSVTHIGEFTITAFQDMAGNVVSTTTDMAGQVIAQTVTTAATVTQAWTTTSASVIASATTMGLEVLGQSRIMGEGLVTATKTSTGEMVSLITNAAGQVIGQFKNIVKEGVTVATGLDAAKKGLASYADGLKGVESAAKKAAEALAEFNKQAGGGKASEFAKGKKGSGDFESRASGGWTQGLTLVGEQGPEFISPSRPMFVTPNHALGGGGTTINVYLDVGGSLVAQSDLEDTIAQAVSNSLRGGSLGLRG